MIRCQKHARTVALCVVRREASLDFRVCPRTAVLLCRSLAKFNDDGRLVLFDGSPLPMTRHLAVLPRTSSRVSVILRALFLSACNHHLHPVSLTFRQNPSRRAACSISSADVQLEFAPRHSSSPSCCARARTRSYATQCSISRSRPSSERCFVARTSLLPHGAFGVATQRRFRVQLHAIVRLVDYLHAEDPSTLRQRIQPVFTRISLFTSST
ncbi:hypothetical protein B0H10DRAFT_2450400 [Mycena sp. CBHHK59/15]|nr:hypothetical protein B0H10DRAFT_2450400 [Mycena sp. CBHHK59/15]